MTESVRIRREDGGVINDCQVWLVYDDDANILIGKDVQILDGPEVLE